MTAARTRDAERTRRLLMNEAERLFAERGVDGTSIDEIARAAGVNKAMISYHFGGKDGLYEAIVTELLESVLGELETLPSSPLSGQAKLREFLRVFARTHGERASVSSMILRELMSGGRRMEEPFRLRILRVFRVLSEVLAQGTREGSFRQVPTIEAHLAMMGALTFFFATRQFRERMWDEGKIPFSPIAPEEYAAFLEQLMTRGLAPDAAVVRGPTGALLPEPPASNRRPKGRAPAKTSPRSSENATAPKTAARPKPASPTGTVVQQPARSKTKTAIRRRTS